MKELIKSWVFDPANKQIKINDYPNINLEGLLMITNISNNKAVLYQFNDSGTTATVNGNLITLSYNTTPMNVNDDLQIFYDDSIPMDDLLTSLSDRLSNNDLILRQLLQLLKPLGITVSGSGRITVDIGNVVGGTIGTVTNITNLPTLANVTTVGTVSTVTNIPTVGGLSAFDLQYNMAHAAFADAIRRNVTF